MQQLTMSSFQLSSYQKAALVLCAPIAGFLLYFLLRVTDDDKNDNLHNQHIATSRQTVVEVSIPKCAIGAVIGKEGMQIKQIQDVTGARLNVKEEQVQRTDTGDLVSIEERIIIVRGKPESVQQAEMLIRKIVADQPIITQEVIYVPEVAVGRIIGKNGETIRGLARTTSVKIDVDRSDVKRQNGLKLVTLQGSESGIHMAKLLISDMVSEEQKRLKCRLQGKSDAQHNDTANQRSCEEAAVFSDFSSGKSKGFVDSASMQFSPNKGLACEAEELKQQAATSNLNTVTQMHTEESFTDATKGFQTFPLTGADQYMAVYVSAVEHPGHFWVQMVSSKGLQLDRLMQDMTEYYTGLEDGKNVITEKEGAIVAARFPQDTMWYRAKINRVFEDKVDLYYVDFGDSEWMPRSSVFEIRKEFLELPFQAVECSLADIQPIGNNWTDEAVDAFDRLSYKAQWKPLMARIYGYREDDRIVVPCLDLVDTNGEQDVRIADELVRLGFAVWNTTPVSSSSATGTTFDTEKGCAQPILLEQIPHKKLSMLFASIRHGNDH